MKITFHTNIDIYKGSGVFPHELTQVPRIGDHIAVNHHCESLFSGKRLPLRLEVVDVTWHEKKVVCELHYSQNDLRRMSQQNVNAYP